MCTAEPRVVGYGFVSNVQIFRAMLQVVCMLGVYVNKSVILRNGVVHLVTKISPRQG